MSDTRDIPAVPLRGGAQMPTVGFGTWPMRGHQAHAAVTAALAAGYRHIDTATMYGNEVAVGRALQDSGLRRDEVFITTKVRPTDAGKARSVLRASLRALSTDYVDLWLVHWPPPQPRLCRMIWNEVLEVQAEGLARSVGVSNYTLAQIDNLAADSGQTPAVNQIRWSPVRYDARVLADHRQRGIVVEGYSPLKDTDLGHPVLAEIAAAHEVTPAQVVLRWHLEHEIPVIPKSVDPDRINTNLDLFTFSLTRPEIEQIDALAGSAR
jgi:2,5-diketo-D-gluconate reductase A